MTRPHLTSLAIELEPFKTDLSRFIGKRIEKVHLDYLNKLSMLYFELKPKNKPTFRHMFCFAYQKPSVGMMKIWLRNFEEKIN